MKLGTITPAGGDVYSYAPDEDDLVLDPKLAEHLSHWGIDIMRLEKTDKSMSEMEVGGAACYLFFNNRKHNSQHHRERVLCSSVVIKKVHLCLN